VSNIWIEREGGVEREKRMICDSGERENGTPDDSYKCAMERKGKEQKAKEILEQRDEMGVDEVDTGSDGEVLGDNLPGNDPCLLQLGLPMVIKGPLDDNGDSQVDSLIRFGDCIPRCGERGGRHWEREEATFAKVHGCTNSFRIEIKIFRKIGERISQVFKKNTKIIDIRASNKSLGAKWNQGDKQIIHNDIQKRGKRTPLFDTSDSLKRKGVNMISWFVKTLGSYGGSSWSKYKGDEVDDVGGVVEFF